jgi:hypothetical protein
VTSEHLGAFRLDDLEPALLRLDAFTSSETIALVLFFQLLATSGKTCVWTTFHKG